jgi:hypothetical protein
VSWLFSLLLAANYQPVSLLGRRNPGSEVNAKLQEQRRRWLILAVPFALLY